MITTGSYRFDHIYCKILIINDDALHHFPNHFKNIIVNHQLGVTENKS